MYRLLLTALTIALLLPAAEGSATMRPDHLEKATAFARDLWPDSSCAGQERVVLKDDLGHKSSGERISGQAVPGCIFEIMEDMPLAETCTTIAHEFGHGAGYGHPDEDHDDAGLVDPPTWAFGVMESVPTTLPGCMRLEQEFLAITRSEAIKIVSRRVPRSSISCHRDSLVTDMVCTARRRGRKAITYSVYLSSDRPRSIDSFRI